MKKLILVIAFPAMLLNISVSSRVEAVPFMYWTNNSTDVIARADLDGTNAVNIHLAGDNLNSIALQLEPAPVPEPSTFMLMGLGLAGLAGGAARRKWKQKAKEKRQVFH